MQLKFETLDYQQEAVEAVVRLFEGEPNHTDIFELNAAGASPVVANRRRLTHGEIGKNLNAVQKDFRQPETQIGEYMLRGAVMAKIYSIT